MNSGLTAEQLGETLCQPLRVLVRIRVLDEPSVGAHRAALAHQLDQPLDPAPARPHALDGPELRFDLKIGLRSSADPIHAATPPIRPPRLRYSSVSIRTHWLTSWRARRATAITPERSSPAAAARAAASA